MKHLIIKLASASAVVGVMCMAAISGEPAVPVDHEQSAITDDALADERAHTDFDPDQLFSAGVGYDLSWHKIAVGGETSSTGGGYELSGTIGQHDAGVMEGGGYTLAGGFWAGGAADVDPDCPIVGDLDCDGVVDVDDLFILLSEWGPCDDPDDCPADLDGNGVVDVDDLFILLANWS